MRKKAISSIVASILLILIIIIAIIILWVVLFPIIKQINDSDKCLGIDLRIVTHEGYTYWDSSKKVLSVQVVRGPDTKEIEMVAFNIRLSNGDSVSASNDTPIPQGNQGLVYYFNLSNYNYEPSEISIFPIIKPNTYCPVTSIAKKVSKGQTIEGIVAQSVGCIPTNKKSSFKCYEGDVYWFDDCSFRRELKESCNYGCKNGYCQNEGVCIFGYKDQDRDNYGTTKKYFCEESNLPDGYAPNPGDCNDNNPLINPSSPPRCEACIDYDCNGFIGWNDPKCSNIPFINNLVSYWKFNDSLNDEKGINNMTLYYIGENAQWAEQNLLWKPERNYPNISFVQGVSCNGKAIDMGGGSYLISHENKTFKENNYLLSYWSSYPCENNGLNANEGAISLWFKRKSLNTCIRRFYNGTTWNCVDSNRNYVFSSFKWKDGNVTSRLYINFQSNTNMLQVAMGSAPYIGFNSWNNVTQVDLGKWTHIILTWKASYPGSTEGNYTVYINGQKNGTFIYKNYDPASMIKFGAWADHPGCDSRGDSFSHTAPNTYNEAYDGLIAEARLFNISINDTQAKEIFDWYDPLITS